MRDKGPHNYMVIVLGSCVTWPLVHPYPRRLYVGIKHTYTVHVSELGDQFYIYIYIWKSYGRANNVSSHGFKSCSLVYKKIGVKVPHMTNVVD